MAGFSDEQWMERLQKGHTDALDELYHRYAAKLFVYCRYTTRTLDAQSVEDLVQDVYLRVIESAHTYNPRKGPFRAWLFRIARNRCIDLLRRDQRVPVVPIAAGTESRVDDRAVVLEEVLADERQDVERDVGRSAVLDALSQCIQELANESERQALLLYYLGGKVYREIAQMLNKSTSTAKNRIDAARAQLKRCLEGKGIHSAP